MDPDLTPIASAISQVAVVVPNLEATLRELVAVGAGPFTLHDLGPHNARALTLRGEPVDYTARFAFTWSAGVQWEVLQPKSGRSIFHEFLDAAGPGLHHVGLAASDQPFNERRRDLEARGWRCEQTGELFDGAVRFAYLAGSPGSPLLEIVERADGFSIRDRALGTFPAADESQAM